MLCLSSFIDGVIAQYDLFNLGQGNTWNGFDLIVIEIQRGQGITVPKFSGIAVCD